MPSDFSATDEFSPACSARRSRIRRRRRCMSGRPRRSASCHYQLIEIAGAGAGGLRMLLDGVDAGLCRHQRDVSLQGSGDRPARRIVAGRAAIGAVNTVVVRDGRLIGYNTDATGFARAIANWSSTPPWPVALIGAGGVGKAIAFALAGLGVAELRMFDSDRAKARTRRPVRAPRQPLRQRRGRAARRRRRGQRHAGRHAARPRHAGAGALLHPACGSPTRSIRRSGRRC